MTIWPYYDDLYRAQTGDNELIRRLTADPAFRRVVCSTVAIFQFRADTPEAAWRLVAAAPGTGVVCVHA
jgi:hypothetical protein